MADVSHPYNVCAMWRAADLSTLGMGLHDSTLSMSLLPAGERDGTRLWATIWNRHQRFRTNANRSGVE
jgi:hypothetical protein